MMKTSTLRLRRVSFRQEGVDDRQITRQWVDALALLHGFSQIRYFQVEPWDLVYNVEPVWA